jgi:zinc protease
VIGRLHRRLVTEKRLAMSVSASYASGIQSSELVFTATVRPGVPFADLERGFAAEIAALARGDITEAEADDARRTALAGKAYDDDDHRQRAANYGLALVQGLTVADVEASEARLAKVTAADINRLARRIVGKSKPVVGVLRPVAPKGAEASAERPVIVK